MAALPDGGAVVVGRFDGRLEIGGTRIASAGAGDGFALAAAADGSVRWVVPLAGAGDGELAAVAADGHGAIAVAGAAAGATSLGEARAQPIGQPGALVARLDAEGRAVWVQTIAGSDYALATAVAFTAAGDVVAAGYYAGTLDPGGDALHAAGALDVWVALLRGGDGSIAWLHRAGGPAADVAQAVAVDASGLIAVGGAFGAWADFAGTRLDAEDDAGDGFVALVEERGFAGALQLHGPGGAVARGLTGFAGGGLGVAIAFDGQLAVGHDRATSEQETGGAAIRVAPGGEVAWMVPSVADNATFEGVAARGGDLVMAGSAGGDLLLDVIDGARGRERGARRLGSREGNEAAHAVAASAQAIYLAGAVAGAFDLGAEHGTSAGDSDGFLLRLRP
ncbi:MAG TPA: hypothetical protein VMZ28_08745 [Kofleriaceae bacterium]|nr:hypothetical protein [Kofleriaceae bacterium]